MEWAEVGSTQVGRKTSRGCIILYTYSSIEYNGEASGGNDSRKTTVSHD